MKEERETVFPVHVRGGVGEVCGAATLVDGKYRGRQEGDHMVKETSKYAPSGSKTLQSSVRERRESKTKGRAS